MPKDPLFKCGLISVQYEIHQNIIHNTITHVLLNFWISVSIRGKAILYADKMTGSMDRAITETRRRQKLQQEYNQKHGITPETVKKAIRSSLETEFQARRMAHDVLTHDDREYDRLELIRILEKEMLEAAEQLDFEKAAGIRDQISELQQAPEVGKVKKKQKKSRRSKRK